MIVDKKPAKVIMSTLDSFSENPGDDDPEKNIVGHRFMYEVPAGEYKFVRWLYKYYKGLSVGLDSPIAFNVKPGEVVYIGNIHGVSLNYCLSNTNEFNSELENIKSKFPVLKNKNIKNISPSLIFSGWGHDSSNDMFGTSKICGQPILK